MEHGAGAPGESEDRPGPGRSSPGGPVGPDGQPTSGHPEIRRLNGHQPKLTPSEPASAAAGDGPAGGGAAGDGPADPDEPIWVKHRPPFYYQPRVILAFLIVVLFIGAVALGSQHKRWPPGANCGKPAIATSTGHVSTGNPVYWAATGAAGRYAVTLGASSVRLTGDRLSVTGTESRAGTRAEVVRQPAKLTGCRWLAHVDMPLPSGQYSLRLYRIDGDHAVQVGKVRIDSDG